jgi:hypothetical protein
MPICQRPARRIAHVAAGHQLELAEVGRDRHESERRGDGCPVAGEVCAQLGRSGQTVVAMVRRNNSAGRWQLRCRRTTR